MILEFEIKNQRITRKDVFRPVANSKNYLYAQFIFSDDWQGLNKEAVFTYGDTTINKLLDENNMCEVPSEVIKAQGFEVGVKGEKDNIYVLVPTNTAFVGVTDSTLMANSETSIKFVNSDTLSFEKQGDVLTINVPNIYGTKLKLVDNKLQLVGRNDVILSEIEIAVSGDSEIIKELQKELKNKVSKEDGKGLSTNDFTDEEKQKLENIDKDIKQKVLCSHREEITGNTGDEHGLAIEDQQVLIKKIQGRSIVLNQLLNPEDFIYEKGTEVDLINGTITILPIEEPYNIIEGLELKNNHIYYLKGCPAVVDFEESIVLQLLDENFVEIQEDFGEGIIFKNRLSYKYNVRVINQTDESLVFQPQLIDLTLMYGIGKEPTDVKVIENDLNGYVSYNLGQIVNSRNNLLSFNPDKYIKDKMIVDIELSRFDTSKEINSKKYTFTGNETWYSAGLTSRGFYRYYTSVLTNMKQHTGNLGQDGLCNKFPTHLGGYNYETMESVRFGQQNSALYLHLKENKTIAEVQELTRGMTVLYQIKEPIENDITLPSGYAVWSGGLQIQEGTIPYELTKEYSLNIGSQVKANILIDKEQQAQIDEIRKLVNENNEMILSNSNDIADLQSTIGNINEILDLINGD